MPIFCETSARWLWSGKSSTSDCARLAPDRVIISRDKMNPGKIFLDMRMPSSGWKLFYLNRNPGRRYHPTLNRTLRRGFERMVSSTTVVRNHSDGSTNADSRSKLLARRGGGKEYLRSPAH